MGKDKDVCIIEFAPGLMCATCFSPHAKDIRHRAMPYTVGTEQAVAEGLRAFIGNTFRCCRVIVLIPRAACVMSVFHFPSSDPAEILDMAELQFVRNTPHKREDIVVDARILERQSLSHSQVAGLMTTVEVLRPCLRILGQAGLEPDVITVNAQGLVPLSRVIASHVDRREGVILGLCLDGRSLWGLICNGKLCFCREEEMGADAASAFSGFVDHCRKEFLQLSIQKGVLFTDNQKTVNAQKLSGVKVEVREISSLVRSVQEQAAFELSPMAFMHLLLARDGGEAAFDLSPRFLKSAREQRKIRSLARHFIIIVGIFLAGLLVRIGTEWHQRRAVVDFLRVALEKNLLQIKEIEDKARLVAAVERRIAERALISAVLGKLAKTIPVGIRLNEANFKEGVLEIQGEAKGLEAARTFLTGLTQAEGFQDVRLVSIDKRPTETAEVVSFRMKAKVR